MDKMVIELQPVLVNQIRLTTGADGKDNCYDDRHYLLKEVKLLPRETLLDLIRLHPIYVVKRSRSRIYEVVAGARMFHIAALCFQPDQEIRVAVLAKPLNREYLRTLQYLDIAVTPLVLSYDGSAEEVYRRITAYEQHEKIPQLFTSQRSFARALGVSPSALHCSKNSRKGMTDDSPRIAENNLEPIE
jgi:hypothetical protein